MSSAQVAPDQSRGFQQNADKQEEGDVYSEEFVMPDYEEEEVTDERGDDDQEDDMIEEEIVEDEDDDESDSGSDDSGSDESGSDDYDSMDGVNAADVDDETTDITGESQAATRSTETKTYEEVAEENRTSV
jgi:hypothetical protein